MQVDIKRNSINKQLHFIPKNVPLYNEKQSILMMHKKNLVFINTSPNYCESNLSVGSFGTVGRACNRNSRAIDGCDLLCCNRGYQSEMVVIHSQCNCRFQWCCSVQCQSCVQTQEISHCL